MEISLELLKLLLPEFIVDHFDFVSSENKGTRLHLYFDEKSAIPEEFKELMLVSKGFHPEITIQDFPIRGKFVYLHIRRRRWTEKGSGKIYQRDWKTLAKGTRMTKDFAAFLKSIDQY